MSPATQAVIDAEVATIAREPWSELTAREGEQIWVERRADTGDVFGLEITSIWDDPQARDSLRVIIEVFRKTGPRDEPDDWSRSLGAVVVLRTPVGVVDVGPIEVGCPRTWRGWAAVKASSTMMGNR